MVICCSKGEELELLADRYPLAVARKIEDRRC